MNEKLEVSSTTGWTEALIMQAIMIIHSKVASLSTLTIEERTAMLTNATSEVFNENVDPADARVQFLRERTSGTKQAEHVTLPLQPPTHIDHVADQIKRSAVNTMNKPKRLATHTFSKPKKADTQKSLEEIIDEAELPEVTGELSLEEIIQLYAIENIILTASQTGAINCDQLDKNEPEELLQLLHANGVIDSAQFKAKIKHITMNKGITANESAQQYVKQLGSEQKKTFKQEVLDTVQRLITPCNYSITELRAPCTYKPSTAKKAEIMAARALMGLQVFVPGDATEYSDSTDEDEENEADFYTDQDIDDLDIDLED